MNTVPVVKQISWLGALPQLVALGLAMLAGFLVTRNSNGTLLGAAVYLGYSFGSRMFLARAHRRGMQLVRGLEFEAAIPEFENSYAFFVQNSWIDRYRSIILMSASATSYREMALCNIAFCYSQPGKGAKGVEYYRRALKEFPTSGLAESALRVIESGADAAE